MNDRPWEKRYPPVGQCIYCRASGPNADLSDEHIIPFGLNGSLILPDASCAACREATHAYEGHCQGHIFGRARASLGFRTRRKKERPTAYPFQIGREGEASEIMVPVADMPIWLMSFMFDPPEVLYTSTFSEKFDGARICIKDLDPKRTQQLAIAGNGRVGITASLMPEKLFQMVAKIGHAFAVAEFGIDGFVHRTTELIRNISWDHPHRFVGGEMFLSDSTPNLHEIGWRIYGQGHLELILVRIRLFSRWGMPTHYVIAGERPRSRAAEISDRLARIPLTQLG